MCVFKEIYSPPSLHKSIFPCSTGTNWFLEILGRCTFTQQSTTKLPPNPTNNKQANSACPNNRQKKWRIWSRGKLATFESMALFFLSEKSRTVSLTPFLVEKWFKKSAVKQKHKNQKKEITKLQWSSLETFCPDKDVLTKRNFNENASSNPKTFEVLS